MGASPQLARLVDSLDEYIRELDALGYDAPARLLRIARLDLKMRLHDISEHELRALCDIIAERVEQPTEEAVIDLHAKRKRH